jgi:hypothetical protein
MGQMLHVCAYALGVLHGVCHTRSQLTVLDVCCCMVVCYT